MEAIVAVSENWGIGYQGQLLFHIHADLRRFRELTMGRTLIMGRKTLETLPGAMGLPHRRNIVLTGQEDFTAPEAEVVHDLDAAAELGGEDAVVIGGESVYRALLPRCGRVYLTKIFAAPPADVFFPDLDADPAWHMARQSPILEEGGLRYRFVDYVRE